MNMVEHGRWRVHWTAAYYDGDWSAAAIDAGAAGAPRAVYEADGNILLNAGITLLLTKLIGGAGQAFDNANTYLGVGSGNPTALAGTVAVTNGSATVTGTGTAFTTALNVGDMVKVDVDGTWYKVLSIGSNTSLTLETTFAGTTDSGLAATKEPLNASQTDLQASTNKFRKAMDATYPQVSGQTLTARSTFGASEANFAINEGGIFNASSGGTMLNRRVQYLGTKVSPATLQLTATITVS